MYTIDMDKDTVKKEYTPKEAELIKDIKASLLKDIEAGKAQGLDVKKLWKDMLNSLENEE
jgi:hypothetical protein